MKKILIILFLFTSYIYASMLPLFFHGNKKLNDTELYNALTLQKPSFYEFWKDQPATQLSTIALLTQTIKNYYKSKGFFHAEVSYKHSDKSITIVIEENKPIVIADLTVISVLNVAKKIPFKVGDIFDAQKFTQSKKEIQLSYANYSYCNAELKAKAWIDIETNKAYLAYEVIPNSLCHIGAVKITTVKNIDEDIIRSLLYFKENDLFSTEKIADTYKNLYGYEGISKVLINTNIENNNSVSINVSISENEKPFRFEGGLGFSSEEGAMASLGLKHRNIFGNLKTASLQTKVTNIKQNIKTNFDMPLSRSNSSGAELGFENEDFSGFKESRIFSSIYLKQRKLPHSFKESLILDNSKTYDSDDETLFPEGDLLIVSPKLEYSYDTRDKILDPSEGYFVKSELTGSILSSLSDASYYKFKLSGAYIFPLSDSILALRASFGTINVYDGEVPASYRFYAGGMNSNRAYTYNQLGPLNSDGDPSGFDSVFGTTIEYRFPIYGAFKGVIFNDNTFIGSDDKLNDSSVYHSAGLGLRYLTPIGPLAFDFGFDLENPSQNYAFHFRIGELF